MQISSSSLYKRLVLMRSPYSTSMLNEVVPIQCCVTGYSSSDSGFASQSVTLVANVWSDALTAGRVADLTNKNSMRTAHSPEARALGVILVQHYY